MDVAIVKEIRDLGDGKLEMLFDGKPSERFTRQQAEETLRMYPIISAKNWRNVELMVTDCQEKATQAAADLGKAERELQAAAELLALADRVYAGTYVPELINRSSEEQLSEILPNGICPADNNTQTYRPLRR